MPLVRNHKLWKHAYSICTICKPEYLQKSVVTDLRYKDHAIYAETIETRACSRHVVLFVHCCILCKEKEDCRQVIHQLAWPVYCHSDTWGRCVLAHASGIRSCEIAARVGGGGGGLVF